MPERADALIIGGGVIGASIAYHLALRGLKPVVFERDLLGSGNTGRSAGGIRAQFTTEVNIKLSLYSIAFYERFRETLGADAEFHQVGYLFLGTTPQHLAHFKERVAFQKKFGVEVSLLTPEEVATRWPFLRHDDVTGATWSDRDGFAGPYAPSSAGSPTKGFVRSSRPIVVSEPWPGRTRVSGGKVKSLLRMVRARSGQSPPGKSVRPTEPRKRTSPAIRPSLVTKVTLPGECPGVWMARIGIPGSPTSSPSWMECPMGGEPNQGRPNALACSPP